jgi:demethylmenaquinone methyltransferase/2-methoxy-6-polyprenyl-1,4-benzoquinol methylase
VERARQVPDPRRVGEDYDADAVGFDQRIADHPATRARFRILDEVQRRITRGAERVLELGCGSGCLTAGLQAPLVVGVDVSMGLLSQARARSLTVLRADAHRLPFADGSFDAIVGGNAVFRHLDYARALRECARLLRRGGRVAVHHYAAQPWSPRHLLHAPPPDPLDVLELDELRVPARAAGLVEERLHLWRAVRVPPYLVPLWPPLAWRFWHHLTFVFRK